MRNTNKVALKLFNIYQIVTWTIGSIVLTKETFRLVLNNGNLELLFISLLLLIIFLFVIYANICLLFNKRRSDTRMFLIFNKWMIFIQICQLSLLGFTAYFIVGIQLGIAYSYIDLQSINFVFQFYRFDVALSYQDSNSIMVAINFVPILIFIWLDKIISYRQNVDSEIKTTFVEEKS